MAKKSMLTYDGLSHMISKLKAKFTVNTYTHSKSGTVHNFTGTGENGKAKITAEFVSGDTFAVNGTRVSAYVGSEPVTSLRAGQYVYFVIDGSNMYFVSGIAVDSDLSSTSSNPVQNKVVNNAITSLKEDLDESTVQIDLNGASEGEPVKNNADTLEGKSLAQIEGMMNDKVRVNLLRPTLQTQTLNGVTCTNNGDGTYTVSGTASAATMIFIGSVTYTGDLKLVGTSKLNTSCYLATYDTALNAKDKGDGVIYTANGTFNIVIAINSGITCDNIVLKPMLTDDLSATYDDFVSYEDSLAINKNAAQKQDVLTYEEIQASTDLSGKIASASAFSPFFNVKQGNLATCRYIQIGKLVVVSFLGALSNGTALGIPSLRNNCIITLRDESVGGIAQVCLASDAVIVSGAGSSNFVDGHNYGGIFAYVCS